jgi:hypothetical protein
VAVGQPRESPQIHANSQIQPLHVRRANPLIVGIAELGYFLTASYLGERIADSCLCAGEILNQLGEVYTIAENKRDIQRVASRPSVLS